MDRVIVVGLGEVGFPLYEILKESGKFEVYGFDLDFEKMKELDQPWVFPNYFDVMHICIPCISYDRFTANVVALVFQYNPKLLIINSTVLPKMTERIYHILLNLKKIIRVAHSPIRGMHNNMKVDIRRYIKYVGGVNKPSAKQASEHFRKAGLKTQILKSSIETELAKLFSTTYRAVMISAFQEFHRIAHKFGADFDHAIDIIDDTNAELGDRPIFYPDVIGGHCLIPNTRLLLLASDSKLCEFVLWSNDLRRSEKKSKRIVKEIEKIKERIKHDKA